jgi:hypothetical protein
MSGAIDAAIAAAAQPVEQRLNAQVRLATGRLVLVNVPADMTDAEILHFAGWMTTDMAAQLRDRRPAGRILVPRGSG